MRGPLAALIFKGRSPLWLRHLAQATYFAISGHLRLTREISWTGEGAGVINILVFRKTARMYSLFRPLAETGRGDVSKHFAVQGSVEQDTWHLEGKCELGI
jgi:hypothetical protein